MIVDIDKQDIIRMIKGSGDLLDIVHIQALQKHKIINRWTECYGRIEWNNKELNSMTEEKLFGLYKLLLG